MFCELFAISVHNIDRPNKDHKRQENPFKTIKDHFPSSFTLKKKGPEKSCDQKEAVHPKIVRDFSEIIKNNTHSLWILRPWIWKE
jgi:hypothetical protein